MLLTLGAWLERWSAETLPLSQRASTAENSRRMIQNHIVPHLGQKRLADLTTADIQRLCNALRQGGRLDGKAGGLSETMVLRVCNLLHQALDAAVRARLLPANPADGVQLPKRRRSQKQILNDGQLHTLMDAIEDDADWHDFFHTELTTGVCGAARSARSDGRILTRRRAGSMCVGRSSGRTARSSAATPRPTRGGA